VTKASQVEATALSKMSSYPLQGDKNHNEMTVVTSLPLSAQSLAHARAAGEARDVAGVSAFTGKLLARVE